MLKTRALTAIIPSLILFSSFCVNCRTRPATVAVPDIERNKAQAAEYVMEGDRHFLASHLYGWRQAEALYANAYKLQNNDATWRKLMLTRFLIMSRQIDEDIPDPRMDETVNELCANPAGDRDLFLCTLADREGRARGQAGEEAVRLPPGVRLDDRVDAEDRGCRRNRRQGHVCKLMNDILMRLRITPPRI